MAWTAWLVGKNESGSHVECLVEFRPDATADPEMVPFTQTVILDPETDGITTGAQATQVLRTKVTHILQRLNKVDALGDLVEANIGVQIPPIALQALPNEGEQIEPAE